MMMFVIRPAQTRAGFVLAACAAGAALLDALAKAALHGLHPLCLDHDRLGELPQRGCDLLQRFDALSKARCLHSGVCDWLVTSTGRSPLAATYWSERASAGAASRGRPQ